MSANTSPIFPITPIVAVASLNTATAVTSRTPITGTTGLLALTVSSTNGTRIDAITVKAQGTTVASTVDIWISDGTYSYLFDEFDIVAITATTVVDAFTLTKSYSTLTLPATYNLYVSQQVQTNLTVMAFGGIY